MKAYIVVNKNYENNLYLTDPTIGVWSEDILNSHFFPSEDIAAHAFGMLGSSCQKISEILPIHLSCSALNIN